jgi:hypothetical protein
MPASDIPLHDTVYVVSDVYTFAAYLVVCILVQLLMFRRGQVFAWRHAGRIFGALFGAVLATIAARALWYALRWFRFTLQRIPIYPDVVLTLVLLSAYAIAPIVSVALAAWAIKTSGVERTSYRGGRWFRIGGACLIAGLIVIVVIFQVLTYDPRTLPAQFEMTIGVIGSSRDAKSHVWFMSGAYLGSVLVAVGGSLCSWAVVFRTTSR